MPVRILFLGDVVGRPGRKLLADCLPRYVERTGVDLVIANTENAANGSGLTGKAYRELRDAGVEVFTMGDHVYKKREILRLFDEEPALCRPANFPPDAPGARYVIAPARDGTPVAAFSVLGRLFMRPVDCPFRAADAVLEEIGRRARCVIVDMHAEATGEKQLMGRYLDGRVSAVLGTHTHVATADEQVLPGGTGYQTDVGMTGPYESILGRRIDRVMHATLTFTPTPFDVANAQPRAAGAVMQIDPATGKCLEIRRVVIEAPDSHNSGP
jgi:metallophosphoesterase (TIGR00282 family)